MEKHPRYLCLHEVRELINSVPFMRDKLMLRILYETGCTLIELVNIKIKDIGGNRICLDKRWSRISGKLAKDISLYAKGNNLSKEKYLLSTRQSPQMSVKRVRQLIQRYTSAKGYGKINPQMFRYYHVAHAYLNGIVQESIAKQLGIKRFRVFQIIGELDLDPIDQYNKFLCKI